MQDKNIMPYNNGIPHGYWEHYLSNDELRCKGYVINGTHYGFWEFHGKQITYFAK